ncbi:MAG: 2-amino-4-hydroxy-6-hydroxymethyldihydropteridine diphosphokinase [Oscillospiraceae bacterium]|jgi:2-amino-4-hydroxy-6-hydroxymethyldihydropteridine diphosphokinase|nr:2-amino-4-hydroxy-6-hydroxymethyldihydropteridine diphosphokinase [Oscillospiraceae bacterium]
MPEIKEAILSLGTNIGDKFQNLKTAITAIDMILETKIIDISKIYITKAVKIVGRQDNFLNCCVKIQTKLLPQTILGCCLGIESALGRVRKFKFESRNIDIDLLLFNDEICNNNDLILPHPKIKERDFVLKPLSDICAKNRFQKFDFNKEMKELNFSNILGVFLHNKFIHE